MVFEFPGRSREVIKKQSVTIELNLKGLGVCLQKLNVLRCTDKKSRHVKFKCLNAYRRGKLRNKLIH